MTDWVWAAMLATGLVTWLVVPLVVVFFLVERYRRVAVAKAKDLRGSGHGPV